MDFPGHGGSTGTEEVYSMSFLAEQVQDVLELENVSKCHLIGHSMGGYVSLAFSKLYPNSVTSITLLNSSAISDTDKKKKERSMAARVFDMNPDIFLEEAMNHLFLSPIPDDLKQANKKTISVARNTSRKDAKACLLGIRDRENLLDWLVEKSFPVQFISGIHDSTISYTSIKEQVEFGDFRLVTLNQSNHMGMIEEFEVCLNAIETFVK